MPEICFTDVTSISYAGVKPSFVLKALQYHTASYHVTPSTGRFVCTSPGNNVYSVLYSLQYEGALASVYSVPFTVTF